MDDKDSRFMKLAVDKAWRYQFLTYPNPAVGACVVRNGEVLAVEAHKKAGEPHAEVLALKEAYLTKYKNSVLKTLTNSFEIHRYLYENHNNFFKDCEIYVTLEPCNHTGKTPACAILLERVMIKKAYIGTLDPNEKASGGVQRLQNSGIEVKTGVLKDKTDDLLLPFAKWQQGCFSFFKIAMREDGSVDKGYITTQDSLDLVHQIRTKIDLLAIGGETVRVDRPRLDCRFAFNGGAPDILIYSKNSCKDFDQTIPLFGIENRKVQCSSELDFLLKYDFVMVEGGMNLLKSLKDKVDVIMIFISHKIKYENKFDISSLNLKVLYSYFLNETDEVIFLG